MKATTNILSIFIGFFSITSTREYGIIPLLIAGAASLGQGIASGVQKNNLASEQERRAKKLLADSQNIKRAKEDDLYQENKDIALKKLGLGLPAKNIYQDQINAQTANMLGQSRLATTSSGDLLSAAAAIDKNANNSLLNLAAKDAEYKDKALSEVSLNNQRIALERARLETIAEQKRQQMRGQAGALENAATENRNNAGQDIIGGITNSIAGAAGLLALKKKKKKDSDVDNGGVDSSKSTDTSTSKNTVRKFIGTEE